MNNTNQSYLTQLNILEEIPLMTVLELANYLGIGRNRAYQLLKNGEIKGFRIGSTWRVSKTAVDKFIYEKSGLI